MKRPDGDIKVWHMKMILHTMLDKLEHYDDEDDLEDVPLGGVLIVDDDFWDDEDGRNKKGE